MPDPYYLTEGDKILYKTVSGVETEVGCVGDEFAICYDSEDGILHKLGKADKVAEWHSATAKRLLDGGMDDMAAALTTIRFPMVDATIDELNKCIAISGRVLGFVDRINTPFDAAPERLKA